MTDVQKPQTNREFMIKLDSAIEHLTSVIEGLDETLKGIKNKELVDYNKRISSLEMWKSEINGMWKLLLGVGIISVVALIKSFFR